jgi:class 3 adenylate cyclase
VRRGPPACCDYWARRAGISRSFHGLTLKGSASFCCAENVSHPNERSNRIVPNRCKLETDAALTELNAAHSAFQRLGARIDARRAAAQGAGREVRAPAGVTRTFVFTDIVRSTDLAELIGDEAWHQLKRWHDELVRSLAAEHGGEVVDSTGDGFFLAFPQARAGLEAAVAIQRALADHRRKAGFAPKVRIGVQVADAVRDSSGYSGVGVHAAARIAASAGADEILAGTAALRAAGELFEHEEPRTLQLKGLSEPVPVATVRWQ